MSNQTCPFLGIPGQNTEQEIGRDYPSFENCCFAEMEPSFGSLLLADQSTYCLSGGYHQCPRFQSSAQRSSFSAPYPNYQVQADIGIPTTSIPLDSEYLSAAVDAPEPEFESDYHSPEEGNNEGGIPPVWLLAGTTFVVVFLIGVGLALFLGWQLIANSAIAGSETLPALDVDEAALSDVAEAAEAVYVVQTATVVAETGSSQAAEGNLAVISEPPPTVPIAVLQPAVQGQTQGQVQPNFPVAVTPTPIIVAGSSALGLQAAAGQPSANQHVNPQEVTAPDSSENGRSADTANVIAQNIPPATVPTATPIPEIDVQVLIPAAPTRRPTPIVPIIPEELPTETPLPTATWLPPVVFFSSIDTELKEGKCTKLTWNVQNVRAVYVASLGVDGQGEKEVCIKDKSKIFDLAVVLPNGSTQIYTHTVSLLAPTPTPTPTWTYTPLPIPTATWTPVPATATVAPTSPPVIERSVRLDSAQPQGATSISCSVGATCEFGLFVTNTGEAVDDIVVVLADRSQPWQTVLVRQDGVFSSDRLIVTEVGQSNTASVQIRVDVPADVAGQSGTLTLYAASQASGEAVRSDTLILKLSIQ